VVALREHPGAVAGSISAPGDHVLSHRVHRNAGILLVGTGGRVYASLAAECGSVGVVVLLVHSPRAGCVLVVAAPGDHEIAAVIHADFGADLIACGGRVDKHLSADLGSGGVVALRVNSVAAPILPAAPPRDHV